MKMFESVADIPWETFPQPEWNRANSVPDALCRMALCDFTTGWEGAYDQFLYAVGNNHAGTYYPIVLPTLPFLNEILERGHEMAQVATLQVLFEIAITFYAEPGYETVAQCGEQQPVKTMILLAVAPWEEKIHRIAEDREKEEATREIAAQLLDALRKRQEDADKLNLA